MEFIIVPLLILFAVYLNVTFVLRMGHSEHAEIAANENKGELKPSLSGFQRLAVLPFANIRSDPQTDFLGFALADQIISALAYVKNILARPSSAVRQYQDQEVDVLTAGHDLNVDFILTGYYLKEADIVRLNIELVNVHSNEMIWREPVEVRYENVFELQDIVTEKVISGLKIQFLQDERGRIQTDVPQNPLAYEYYLRALSYPNTNQGDQLAAEMLKKCIELDPTYPPAYSQLGFRTKQLAQFGLLDPEETKRAENYLLKALSLNGELLSALGNLAILYTETARAEKAVEITRKMLEINPNNATAHYSLGYIYRFTGMLNESRQEMEIAVALDPKNSRFRSLGVTYMNVSEHEKALDALEIDNGSAYALGWQGVTLFRQGNQEHAIDHFDRVIAMEPEGLWGLVATVYNKGFIEGNIEEGLMATHKLEQANIVDAEAWYYWAGFYAMLGDSDGCIRALQRAVDGGYFNYPFMRTDFFLESVRDDLEFQRILDMAKAKHEAFKKRLFPASSVSTE
jgi:TolB-like protein/Flp pilus assembly protein TadD